MSDKFKVLDFPKKEDSSEWANINVKNASAMVNWKKSIVIGEDTEGGGHIWIYNFEDKEFLARSLFQLEKAVKEMIAGIE